MSLKAECRVVFFPLFRDFTFVAVELPGVGRGGGGLHGKQVDGHALALCRHFFVFLVNLKACQNTLNWNHDHTLALNSELLKVP